MALGDQLRTARKKHGYTQKELARRIGAKHNSVSNWENGQNMPDPSTIESICAVLGITPNYLFTGNEEVPEVTAHQGYTAEDRLLLRQFHSLSAEGRGAVQALMRYYIAQTDTLAAPAANLNRTEKQPQLTVLTGKISSQSVAAGTGTYLDADSFDTIAVQQNSVTSRAAYYVPVSGDSMTPRFNDGDILVVEDAPVRTGEIGIFTLDGHGYVKVRSNRELLSLNPDYAPIPMNDDILCNGKVIGVLDPSWIVE